MLTSFSLDYNMDIVIRPQININHFKLSFALGGVYLGEGLKTDLLQLGMDFVLSSS
jgi:hypothetical protein